MPTRQQDSDFAKDVVEPDNLLDRAIEWISQNMNPEDVFSWNALEIWARDNGFTDDKKE